MAILTCPQCGAKNRVDGRASKMQPVCGRCGTRLSLNTIPLQITDDSIGTIISQAGSTPVLVDCWAPWCGPCRAVGPIIDQLAAESGGRFVIGKLNVDENQGTAAKYQIDGIPTMLIFHGGKLVDRIVGLQPKPAILQKLNSYAAQPV